MATYNFDYALQMVRQAIDFAEMEGDFKSVRKWTTELKAAYDADLSDLREQLEAVAKAEPLLDEEGKIATWLEPTGLPFLEPEQGVSTSVYGGEVFERPV